MRNSCGSIIKHTNEGASTHQEEIMAAGPHQCCNKSWISYPSASRVVMKQSNFGEDEEDLIIKLHALLGDRWSLIAGRLPDRTESEVKNYWDSHLKGKLTSVGIDPNNHRVNQMLRPFSICSKNQKRAISDVEDTTYKSCFSRKLPFKKSSKSPFADSSTSSSKESVGSCEMNQYSHNGLQF